MKNFAIGQYRLRPSYELVLTLKQCKEIAKRSPKNRSKAETTIRAIRNILIERQKL